MNPIALVLVLLLISLPVTAAEEVPREHTQAGMNEAAGARLRAAEADMAKALESLAKMADGQPGSLAKLRRAQAAWEPYRDAQLEAFWPSTVISHDHDPGARRFSQRHDPGVVRVFSRS